MGTNLGATVLKFGTIIYQIGKLKMATISVKPRKLKNGTSYRARVRITKRGKIIDKDDQTFKNMETAEVWAKRRAGELEEKQDAIANGTYYAPKKDEEYRDITVGELIKEYITNPLTSKDLGRTKGFVLESLLNHDIAYKVVNHLTHDDLIEHCKIRLAGQEINNKMIIPSPQTVYHDVTYLHSVIKVAKSLFKVNANLSYHEEAIPLLVKLGLIGRSKKRDRRPTREELRLLEEGLKERENHRSAKIPFCDILQFSIYTAMRVGEITKLKWSDVDHEHKTIIVKDRKDPRRKVDNNWEVPLLGEAYPILMKQKENIDPKNPNLIFPYNSRSITAGWQRVRAKLGIEDLRYHDLRREAASRLAEQGHDIRTVARVTGHKNLNILYDIYTALEIKDFSKKENEKYQNSKEEA
jgi:integrase